MSAELSALSKASGNMGDAAKPHTLKPSKQQQKDLQTLKSVAKDKVKGAFSKKTQTEPEPEPEPAERNRPHRFDTTRVSGKRFDGEVVDETPVNRGNAIGDSGVKRVYSERVTSSPTALPGSRKSISAPKANVVNSGPLAITPPGPTASSSAASRAAKAAKGSKNTSTVKVAERMVDLDEGPNFGKPVYSITDVPRQWKNNV